MALTRGNPNPYPNPLVPWWYQPVGCRVYTLQGRGTGWHLGTLGFTRAIA